MHPRTAGPTAARLCEGKGVQAAGAAWTRMCGCTTGTPDPGSLCAASSAPRCSATSECARPPERVHGCGHQHPGHSPCEPQPGGPAEDPLPGGGTGGEVRMQGDGGLAGKELQIQIRVRSHIPEGEFGKIALRLRFPEVNC